MKPPPSDTLRGDNSAPPAPVPDAATSEIPVPDDDLAAAVEDTIYRMHLDHNQPQPGEKHKMLMTVSWREHLAKNGVPWHALPGLYDSAVATKARGNGRGFMPVIGDLLFEWEKVLEDGYWENRNAPEADFSLPALGQGKAPMPGGINTDKAPAFVKSFVTIAKRGAVVTCHCAGDKWCHNGKQAAQLAEESWGSYWVCATGKCDFKIKAAEVLSLAPIPMPAASSPTNPEKPAAPEELSREYSDKDLLDALVERCQFKIEKIKSETALAFARHMQKVAPLDLWSHALVRGQWQTWREIEASAPEQSVKKSITE